MMDHIAAYTAWAEYMDNAPMSDVFTDAYHNRLMALWMTYIEALSNGTAVKAYSDLVALKTPTIAPVTDLDPTPATLPEGRYHGTLNKNRLYIHVPALRADFRVIPSEICGVSVDQIAAGQLLEVSINASFETALRVVIVGNQDSVKAYEVKAAPQPACIDITRKPRNLAEARLQADQRKKDALQREQARKEAHQIHPVTTFNNGAGYDMDSLASDYDNIDMTF